jgi:hypothetical protein
MAAPLPPILHDYGPHVRIAAQTDVQPAAAAAAAEPSAPAEVEFSGTERLGLTAFRRRNEPSYAEMKAGRPYGGHDWDSKDAPVTPPHSSLQPELDAAVSAHAAAHTPTSQRLTDSVSVGLIMVSGPDPELIFSDDDQVHVSAEVQNGLTFLGTKGDGDPIRWVYDIRHVELGVQPDPSADDTYEGKERVWRDPALAELGFQPGIPGVLDYIEDLRSQHQTSWTYCAFFTKYPVHHFAYAGLGGPRLVMDFSNDGWGEDSIDRVFAHESGHIFGAPDEYAASNCSCGGSYGFHNKPNANCANCAAGGGVSCLMRKNDWTMCEHTRYHLGYELNTIPTV